MEQLTTSAKLLESFKSIKKKYVADLLNISRPTLDTKLKKDKFKDEEIAILIENKIISI